jgi:hypothetical protein
VSAAYFVSQLIPGLIDATAYVAEATREAGLRSIVNMSQISARRESKAMRPAMTGFPSAYFRFAMQYGCLNVSMPFGCHLFVSCQAAVGSHLLNISAEEATTASRGPSLN